MGRLPPPGGQWVRAEKKVQAHPRALSEKCVYIDEYFMKPKASLYKKLHKWPGLIISIVLFYYALTGIFLNHRALFSGIDVNRELLPTEFRYHNWNNAALKGDLIISSDSILVFGNIGVWITDSTFQHYRPMNAGFKKGTDNRKIFDLHRSRDGQLYAATLFGLFAYDQNRGQWASFDLDAEIKRFVAIESVGDTLYVINRSVLFKGKSAGTSTRFEKIELVQPPGYKNEVTLFQTIWQIHSGEIFGLPGKLFVDLLGIVVLFLSLTGWLYFLFPGWIKRRKRENKAVGSMVSLNRWSLKWHNRGGAWLFGFLIVLFFSGMFLRPPLLIAIAPLKVNPIPFSHLSQPNPWHDKLRDLHYDEAKGGFLLSTSSGLYFMDAKTLRPVPFKYQPPVSVMGITVLEPYEAGAYLVGSFSGLFLWHPDVPEVYNFVTGRVHQESSSGRPVGDFKVTGLLNTPSGQRLMVDYEKGVLPLEHQNPFPPMPPNILKASGMSLWTFALETHTGRIFGSFMGLFYILIVPLSGLLGIMVVLSGYLLWRKRFKKRKKAPKML